MRRHKFDPSSLVAGILFIVLAVRSIAVAVAGHGTSVTWLVPTVLVGLGVIGLLRIVFASRRRQR